MANNLRYLLEHFCLDGQKIDVSSQLDEENANNIEKINTQTIPSINTRIDDIKNTDIPNINSRIDGIKNTDIPSINQKINTINNTTIPSIQENVNAVNEKADRINESVAKNTGDIGTLSNNVTMQGNAINSINTEKIPNIENNVNELTTKVSANTDSINGLTTKVNANTSNISALNGKVDTNTSNISALNEKVNTNKSDISNIIEQHWIKIADQTSNGIHAQVYRAPNLPFIEIHATLTFPQSIAGGTPIKMRITDGYPFSPYYLSTAPVYLANDYPNLTGYLFVYYENNDLIVGFRMSSYNLADTGVATIIYRY